MQKVKVTDQGNADNFVMTRQFTAALDEGLEDIRAGRTVTLDEAKQNLEAVKKQWRTTVNAGPGRTIGSLQD